jgi:hypothetical protein
MCRLIVLLAVPILLSNTSNAVAAPIAPVNTVRAEYNPAIGNIKISANKVLNWYVEHFGHDSMTGDDPVGLPSAFGLVSDNDKRIGESWFSQFSADLDLGNVAATGIPDDGSLQICWNYALSPPEECFPIKFVPEPTSFTLSVLALCFITTRRR